MDRGSLGEALSRAMARNEAAGEFYRNVAQRSGERWLAGMAHTWHEQREGLAKELAAIPSGLSPATEGMEVALPAPFGPDPDLPFENAAAIVETMKRIEDEDSAFFEALADSLVALPETSQQLSSIAERARLRVRVAESHLDLLALG